jgi:hypothetical protein
LPNFAHLIHLLPDHPAAIDLVCPPHEIHRTQMEGRAHRLYTNSASGYLVCYRGFTNYVHINHLSSRTPSDYMFAMSLGGCHTRSSALQTRNSMIEAESLKHLS